MTALIKGVIGSLITVCRVIWQQATSLNKRFLEHTQIYTPNQLITGSAAFSRMTALIKGVIGSLITVCRVIWQQATSTDTANCKETWHQQLANRNSGWQHAEKSQSHPPQKCPLCGVYGLCLNKRFPEHTQIYTSNQLITGSAAFE